MPKAMSSSSVIVTTSPEPLVSSAAADSVPRVMITDKLRSYGAAKRDLAPSLEHRSHKGLNNAAEVSHKPTRRRERVMGRFKSARHAQQFLSSHDQINVLFRPRRHKISAISYRHARSDAFAVWHDITCEIAAT